MTMARLLCVWILWMLATVGQAQPFSQCKYTYFGKTKLVSTSICLDKDGRWGEARAFDRQGKQIYHNDERRIAGHANTHFSFYPSGAVHKAEYSSAPDAGIQWYRSVTTFSETGEQIHFSKQSHDEMRGPGYFLEQLPEPPKHQPPPSACVEVHLAEVWLVNKSRFAVKATGAYTGSLADPASLTLAPGDSGRGGAFTTSPNYEMAAGWPQSRIKLEAVGTRRRARLRLVGPYRTEGHGPRARRFWYAIQ